MTRRVRLDDPGTYHHVMNRAVARRPLFESRLEGRYFLARLAERVRSGQIEVLAYSLMTTHYHLLVRSPQGQLSGAIRLVSNAYSRWFNRRHRRDGPLFRGRFISRRVGTLAYRIAVLRYIDMNPVQARIVAHPASYALGSARRYASCKPGPWLSRGWIRDHVDAAVGGEISWGAKYRTLCARAVPEGVREMVEARLMRSGRNEDLLDELSSSAPPRVLEWMHRKARLADGARLPMPVAGASSVMAAIESRSGTLEEIPPLGDSRAPATRATLSAGLLRDLAGARVSDVALALGVADTTARRHIRAHERHMAQHTSPYARVAEEAARAAIHSSTGLLRPA